jgi:hypothetical protein
VEKEKNVREVNLYTVQGKVKHNGSRKGSDIYLFTIFDTCFRRHKFTIDYFICVISVNLRLSYSLKFNTANSPTNLLPTILFLVVNL